MTFSYGENEAAVPGEMHRTGIEILRPAGARRLGISEGNDHAMGGFRMGSDAHLHTNTTAKEAA